MTASADEIEALDLFIPSFSAGSFDSLRPAVSESRKGMESIIISSSIVSRVVPGRSATIALSRPRRAFNRLDLPVLGLPAIVILTPFFITEAFLAPRSSLPISAEV